MAGFSTAFKKILVCTDGSEYSEGAVREAIGLARASGGTLSAMTVLDFNPEFDALAPDLLEKIEEETAKIVNEACGRAEKETVSCKTVVRRSNTPYLAISQEANESSADLVVMGRRGRTGLSRLLMGSVTKRVIGHSHCNVLVVPKAAQIQRKQIVAATDGSNFGDAACTAAIALAKLWGAGLAFVSVVPGDDVMPLDIVSFQMQKELIAASGAKIAEKAIARAREIAEAEGFKAEYLTYAGAPADGIVQATKDKKADLLVIGSHGRTGVDRLLLGSVAERVVGHAECATLVVKKTGHTT